MKCSDIEVKWEAYIKGTLSDVEEQQIDQHVEMCEFCTNKLDVVAENEQQLAMKNPELILKKAKRKHRFKNVTLAIVSGIILYAFLQFSSITYYATGERSTAVRTTNQVIYQMTHANLFIKPYGYLRYEVDPTFKIDYTSQPVLKTVGHGESYVGNIQLSTRLDRLVSLDPSISTSVNSLYFLNRFKPVTVDDESTFQALNRLPEGTVSEVAVTFKDSLSYEQLFQFAKQYELEVVWAGIETFPLAALEEEYLLVGNNVIGQHELALTQELLTYAQIVGENGWPAEQNAQQSEALFYGSLKYLEKNDRLASSILQETTALKIDLKEVLRYIEDNGIRLYGAVITGPTKQMLALKDDSTVLHVQLGESALWNW